MEMLNQSITTPSQHQHNISGVDSIGNFIKQQQRQQPSQMSGPHQRPSNGSNILEQHAMNPATTGVDPSNRVFNDQQSSINGRLHQSNSHQIPHQSMMGVQQQNQQPNQMVSYNLVSEGSSGRLPPLTLKSSNFSSSNTVLLSNGTQCQLQSNSLNMPQGNVQQSQQINHCEYDQNTITQNKVSTSMSMNEQLFDQHSLNSQQEMERPARMNTPVLAHQHMEQQNMQSQQQMVFTQQNQQNQNQFNGQTDMMQNCNQNHLSMNQNQFQSGHQAGNQMVSSFQSNQNQEQVSHLGHMDQQPPTQHSMNSVPQSQSQQRLGQMGCNPNQMNVQNTLQSPTTSNMSMNMSSSSSSSFSMTPPNKNTNSSIISPSSIPMNANSTTQLLVALNNNSPVTQEQLQEIQSMTNAASDGSEMLLLQEPRLKQYSALKDLSTTELRIECKKRSLPSAGTKVKLCDRLIAHENEVLDERNNKLMQEYTHRQQMYEAQTATLKAFQAKKAALLQAQNCQNGVLSNGTSVTLAMHKKVDGPPPKRKRVCRPKKQPQLQSDKQTIQTQQQNVITINSNQAQNMPSAIGNNANLSTDIDTLLGRNTNQSSANSGNMGTPPSQNTSNVFGGMNQNGTTGFYMKDNSCFSTLGSGCRLISSSSSEEGQFGGTGRAFQAGVPPPPENSQMQFQSNDQLLYGVPDQISNQRNDSQSRPTNLNQQQSLGNQNMNQGIPTMFNVSNTSNAMQQHQQQPQQQQQQQQNMQTQNYMNSSMTQNGLQASPCVADQAGPSPNMPVSDPTATTSGSPMIVSSAVENTEAADMMDHETMQKLLSPATLRAREELLTQQQSQINELVKLIQQNHDTLREQQHQINLAKRQQKLRQRQNSQSAIAIDKQVNSRCIQHAIKSRQNFQNLTDITKQQDSIRAAETRLIEQLHINTATDDIARLIKQDGRTALVIVSLLHDYRTTREQNNRVKTTTVEPPVVEDKTPVEVVAKKKAPARKRNSSGVPKPGQNRRPAQLKPTPEIDFGQLKSPQCNPPVMMQSEQQTYQEFPTSQVKPRVRTQSDVDMEEIFKTVIDASRCTAKSPKKSGNQQQQQIEQPPQQQQYDNEVISLPSEVSSPIRAQSQNSVQSVFSDGSYTRTMTYQQEESPQQMSYTLGTETESSCSPNEVHITQNEMMQMNVQDMGGQQSETTENLPQFEQTTLDYDLENQQFHDAMMFSDDSNQDYVDNNCQNNRFADSDFPDIDQMVANMRDSNPLSCPLDDLDLHAILNCWSDNCDPNQNDKNHNTAQNGNGLCDNNAYDGSLNMSNEDMNWNNYSTQSNIINQAFEQSQM